MVLVNEIERFWLYKIMFLFNHSNQRILPDLDCEISNDKNNLRKEV